MVLFFSPYLKFQSCSIIKGVRAARNGVAMHIAVVSKQANSSEFPADSQGKEMEKSAQKCFLNWNIPKMQLLLIHWKIQNLHYNAGYYFRFCTSSYQELQNHYMKVKIRTHIFPITFSYNIFPILHSTSFDPNCPTADCIESLGFQAWSSFQVHLMKFEQVT